MKYSISAMALLATLTSAIHSPPIPGMSLIWQDTFIGDAGSALSTKSWDIARDTDTNNELQEYSSSNSNIQLSGGETLQLVPWKSKSAKSKRNTAGWTSGRVETKKSFTPSPGKQLRVQAGIRIGQNAHQQGMWPAFWMLGDSMRHGTQWPLCGEIDIFEQVNGDGIAHGTVHCGFEGGGPCNEPMGRGASTPLGGGDDEFHNWSISIDRTSGNWATETIKWERDGVVFHELCGADLGDEATWGTLAHSPMYVLLNVAVGGNWPGSPNAETEDGYGSMMEVSYLGIYSSD